MECARSFRGVAGWNEVEYHVGTKARAVYVGEILLKNGHGTPAGQEDQLASHNGGCFLRFFFVSP